MALYPFRCPGCGATQDAYAPMTVGPEPQTCECGEAMVRVYTVPGVVKDMAGHFNHALGVPVSNRRELMSHADRMSDEASKRLNLEHRFEMVDPRDTKALGVTPEGLDTTARRARAEGRTERKKLTVAMS